MARPFKRLKMRLLHVSSDLTICPNATSAINTLAITTYDVVLGIEMISESNQTSSLINIPL